MWTEAVHDNGHEGGGEFLGRGLCSRDGVGGPADQGGGDGGIEIGADRAVVTVCFERADARRFDLVIGADGLHSGVRRLVFGPEAQYLRHRDHYFAFANADAALGEDRSRATVS